MAQDLGIGINLDSAPERQPENTYRFSLNAVQDTVTGDMDFVNSEPGNSYCFALPEGYLPLGKLYLGGNRVLLFSTDGDNSEIGLYKHKCKYTTLINSECLGFQLHYPIQATYRLRRGCDEVIYFTDGHNPVRFIDINNLKAYYSDDFQQFIDEGGEPDEFEGERWDCEKMRMFRGYRVPFIESADVLDVGGSLPIGSYRIAIQYLDRDLNTTPFIYGSLPVSIFPESSTTEWGKVLGGVSNLADPLIGLPPTTKSIEYEIQNLDDRFAFYRVAVVAYNNASGQPTGVFYSRNRVMGDNIFTLSSLDEFEEGSIDEVRQVRADIESAKHLTQIENRLILANITGKDRDYAAYQRATNDIEAIPVSNPFNTYSGEVGDSKSATYMFDNIGYMGDEIYAFGIVYVYADGGESPVIHIPGRSGTSDDLQLLTVVNLFPGVSDNPGIGANEVSLYDVKHLGFTESNFPTHTVTYLDENGERQTATGQVPRFMVHNTGSEDIMAYHHLNTSRYPMTKDCDGEFVFGDNAGTPIRHHRFPDRLMIPTVSESITGDVLNNIGIRFSNITYPDSDIVGHYIVRAEREGNESIIDKGMLLPNRYDSENRARVGKLDSDLSANIEEGVGEFYSPKTLYGGLTLSGYSHLGLEGLYNVRESLTGSFANLECNGDPAPSELTAYIHSYIEESEFTNLSYTDPFGMIIRGVQQPFGGYQFEIQNRSYSNQVNVINPLSPILQDFGFVHYGLNNNSAFYASVKGSTEVYTSLGGLTYIRTHQGMLDNVAPNTVMGGDTFIQPLDLFSYYRVPECPGIVGSGRVGLGTYRFNMFVESTLNASLRGHFPDRCNRVIDFNWEEGIDNQEFLSDLSEYALNKVVGDFEDEIAVADICPEFYRANLDFSRGVELDFYFPLSDFFDYCDGCLGEFRHRVHYSEQSFQEEQFDNFTVFLPNNYRDIEGNHGEVTNVFTKGENLIIHCEEMLWVLPKSHQQQVTDEFVVFMGTGEFFAIEPKPMTQFEQGGAGSQDKWATIKTPHGIVFVDQIDRKVYLLGEGLQAISDDGLNRWHRVNLQPFMQEAFESIGVEMPYSVYEGVGIHSVYDPEHRRVILTKLDYEPLQDVELWDGDNDIGTFVWLEGQGSFALVDEDEQGAGLTLIELGDPEYFRNRSYTLSYSFLSGKWASWHSYMPLFCFYNKDTFFSTNGAGFWSHDNLEQFHNFYGVDYKHILEFSYIDSAVRPQVWDGLVYQSMGRRWAGGWIDVRNRSFDKVILYNNYQSTGVKDIVIREEEKAPSDILLSSVRNDTGRINVTRRERVYYLNYFRNLVVNYNEGLFTDDWDQIREEYFIDKVSNENVLDSGKDWKDQNPMREDFIVARFINTDTDIQIRSKYFLADKV